MNSTKHHAQKGKGRKGSRYSKAALHLQGDKQPRPSLLEDKSHWQPLSRVLNIQISPCSGKESYTLAQFTHGMFLEEAWHQPCLIGGASTARRVTKATCAGKREDKKEWAHWVLNRIFVCEFQFWGVSLVSGCHTSVYTSGSFSLPSKCSVLYFLGKYILHYGISAYILKLPKE